MTLTPQQARARLAETRRKLELAAVLARGRGEYNPQAAVTLALLDVITFLEDALA